MKIVLIRHGKTAGNLEHRYIGATDEPLCPQGIRELTDRAENRRNPPVEHVYVSPMLRCRQTKELLYEAEPETVVPDLREQAFGRFENRCYEELKDLSEYRAWIESAGAMPIPGGETQADFFTRCRMAFGECMRDALCKGYESVAVVSHGGVIMAVLSANALPVREFYGWQAENGRGFLLETAPDGKLQLLREI